MYKMTKIFFCYLRDERALARQSVADPSQTAREIQSSVRGNTTRASISTYGKVLLTQLI
jgi:hypothetical protein